MKAKLKQILSRENIKTAFGVLLLFGLVFVAYIIFIMTGD